MPLEIQISSTATLGDLESQIAQIVSAPEGTNYCVILPRNSSRVIFKHARVVALLVSAAQRGTLTVKDTHHVWGGAETSDYLRSVIPALAAISYAGEVVNSRAEPCPLRRHDLWEQIQSSGGLMESHLSSEKPELVGNSITFAALDPDFPEPGLLAGYTSQKDSFIKWFTRLRLLNDFLRHLPSPELDKDKETKVTPQYRFAEYVYEVFSNTFQHANKAANGSIIPGLRYISLQKHIATNVPQLRQYAGGFSALEGYLDAMANGPTPTKLFCEISIGDQGQGIIDHFSNARPEWTKVANDPSQRLGLLRRILRESLSSKRTATGAGGGLQNATAACAALRAFVNIRTDRFWLYSSYPGQSERVEWADVSPDRPLPRVSGVHFSCLIPLVARAPRPYARAVV